MPRQRMTGVPNTVVVLGGTPRYESDAQADLQLLASTYDNVDISVFSGPVAEQITAVSKDYDLIIMGASERSWGASAIFGTVVDKVIEQTDRNIFVVRV